MRAKLDKSDMYHFDQSTMDISQIQKKQTDDDPLSWWSDNLKTKVK